MKKTTENSAALARNDELVVQDLPDEVLVYDLKSNKAHCLNKTAAFIWKHCDGRTTAEEIAEMMAEEWHTPVTEDAVWFALNKLSKAELLQERIVLPEAKAGMTRRSAVRQLGFGALLAVPVVMSIVTPTPAAANSVPQECLACNLFGSGSGRAISCPPVCGPFIGVCYNNASCNGIGGQFPPASCVDCFNLNPTSSSWRVVV
jgi:coenzyme PQQ synthesis protein D (PqqD)